MTSPRSAGCCEPGSLSQGYDVLEAGTGREAEQLLASAPELVILDLGLPDATGQDLLRRWRAAGNDVPVLILSSRTDEAGIVEALELGADDYLTKPFGMKELVTRIRTALRHRLQAQGERALFQSDDLSVDLVRRIVRLRGEEVSLTPRESDVLRVMVQHAGKVLTHQFLIRQVWGGGVDVQTRGVLCARSDRRSTPIPSSTGTSSPRPG